ncbi:MAG: L-seryl-tRNA(Sec) selenium transferase [Desulfuromonadales bacterium]|nr:L-seryl-tRNA(Sec) selenium transferase [Desulfuromonadales bacterium]
MSDRKALLRTLPKIDKLLNTQRLTELATQHPHMLLCEAAQSTVEALRQQLLDSEAPLPDLELEAVAAQVEQLLKQLVRPSLRKVINVTGTLLHTNLGRAPLSDDALQAINHVARGYSNLEYDLEAGQRGKRFSHIESLICKLTGGEAATVVNNNAGAVMLALAALGKGKSALVSRGELIEIGGSFRIPEIMAASGVKLVEVGATNKTHIKDYADAIDSDTALILKVHTSNYRILGFTESVSGSALAGLGQQNNIPVLEDLGSGLLLDLTPYGLPREPTVREVLKSGIDLVTFSGDKLLGGPQAGIIVGKHAVIDKLRKHPMARALRSDKLTLAALEATLRSYLDPQKALQQIPTLKRLSLPPANLEQRCQALLPKLKEASAGQAECTIVETTATVGGGALPLAELPGRVIALKPDTLSLNQLTTRLRNCEPAVIGRVQDDRLLIDPRTLEPAEEAQLLSAIKAAFSQD